MTRAPLWITAEGVEAMASKVRTAPRLEVAPEATAHVQRATWARDSQRTRSQGRRLTADERRRAVALAVASRVQPARWSAVELAAHVGVEVEEVESVLSEWEAEGLIVRPAPREVDVMSPALLERLGVRQP